MREDPFVRGGFGVGEAGILPRERVNQDLESDTSRDGSKELQAVSRRLDGRHGISDR